MGWPTQSPFIGRIGRGRMSVLYRLSMKNVQALEHQEAQEFAPPPQLT